MPKILTARTLFWTGAILIAAWLVVAIVLTQVDPMSHPDLIDFYQVLSIVMGAAQAVGIAMLGASFVVRVLQGSAPTVAGVVTDEQQDLAG